MEYLKQPSLRPLVLVVTDISQVQKMKMILK